MAPVRELASKEEWKELVESGDIILADFAGKWCPPCQKIKPIFEELAANCTSSKLIFLRVDIDEFADLMQECGVKCMPYFQVWQDGQKLEKLIGAGESSIRDLKLMVEKYQAK